MAVNLLKTFLLPELVKGLMVTARTLVSRKYTLNYPEEKTGGVHHHRLGCGARRHAAHHAL
jgi:formate hydrogenlyase subunit 6/NADH:ubiquinone oxidoreductase subunit I